MKELTEQEYIDELKSEDIDFKSIPKKFRTENVCLAAVIINGLDLMRVKNQTEEICLAAVKSNGWALKYVENQTEEICLAAVNEDGSALQFVKNQTDEICLAAVKQLGWALEYVKNQTDEICMAAVNNDGAALQFIKNQTDEIYSSAVKINGWALEYVKKQTKAIYKEAFNNNLYSFIYVDADIYEYDKDEILNAFKVCGNCDLIQKAANKTAEILSKLSDEDLVRAVNVDLKEIFTKNNLRKNSALFNIKSKADMLAGVIDAVGRGVVNKKPKII